MERERKRTKRMLKKLSPHPHLTSHHTPFIPEYHTNLSKKTKNNRHPIVIYEKLSHLIRYIITNHLLLPKLISLALAFKPSGSWQLPTTITNNEIITESKTHYLQTQHLKTTQIKKQIVPKPKLWLSYYSTIPPPLLPIKRNEVSVDHIMACVTNYPSLLSERSIY